MLQVDGILGVDCLRNTIRADSWCIAIVVVTLDISAVACVVCVVADARTPRIALCAEVELPPDTIENVGAGVAAVHLRGNAEVGRHFPVGVRQGLWRVGLERRCTVGWIGLDGGWIVDGTCCCLAMLCD
jgi:hypothetical protein